MTDSADPSTKRSYVAYSADLERPRPDEEKDIAKIVKVLKGNNERAFKKHKHAIRDAHAKSHGVLHGELTVYSDLPDHLRQGLFATPATYPVIARLSSTAGIIRSDQVRGVRAIALKVLGVHGPRALPEDDATTQDFVMVNSAEFPFKDAHHYSITGMLSAWTLARTPDPAVRVAGWLLRGVKSVLSPVGASLPMNLALFAGPNAYILGQTFYTAAPLRYGDYVAKISVAPVSASLDGLERQNVDPDAGADAQRDLVVDFFHTNAAEYEVRAQLCTNPDDMPIEDATKEWSQDDSPYVGVAKITFPVQSADSPERRAYADDVLSFN